MAAEDIRPSSGEVIDVLGVPVGVFFVLSTFATRLDDRGVTFSAKNDLIGVDTFALANSFRPSIGVFLLSAVGVVTDCVVVCDFGYAATRGVTGDCIDLLRPRTVGVNGFGELCCADLLV